MKRRIKFFWLIIGTLFFTMFVKLENWANTNSMPSPINSIERIPGFDKVGHIVLLTLFSFFFNMLLHRHYFKVTNTRFYWGSLLSAFIITIEEFHQMLIPARTFDLVDLLCNYIGIFLGQVMVIKLMEDYKRKADKEIA